MKRIPFVVVDARVEEMYDFTLTDLKDIEQRCLDIQNFIEACGWNLDDYIRQIMGYESSSCLN